MNQTVVDGQPRKVISGKALLLRVLICIITIATLSFGGALLMHAAIDPEADATDGAASIVATPADSR